MSASVCNTEHKIIFYSEGSPLQVDQAFDQYAEWHSGRYEEYVSRTIYGFGTSSKFHSYGTSKSSDVGELNADDYHDTVKESARKHDWKGALFSIACSTV